MEEVRLGSHLTHHETLFLSETYLTQVHMTKEDHCFMFSLAKPVRYYGKQGQEHIWL